MTGNLDQAVRTLLQTALPGLFDGTPPPVALSVASQSFQIDPNSAEATAGEPRPDDRNDDFAFNAATPAGPYTLTQPPYPGPRRVRLTTDAGDRIPLTGAEVVWDVADPRVFSLDLRATRDVSAITGVQVLYGVTAVFTKIKLHETTTLILQSADAQRLIQAEALALSVIALNREPLVEAARALYEDGDYGAGVEVKNVHLVEGTSPAADQRALVLKSEIELKASRALRSDEGAPIERILSPGRPVDPDRPVDVHIDVEA